MAHVLIAGAGYVGLALARMLREAGHQVTGLKRTPPVADHGIAWLAADVTRPETLTALPRDLDAVVCALAPAGRSEAAYREIYLEGTANLLAALPSRDLPLLLVSSTGVYGQDAGDWVDEQTPPAPSTATGRVLLEAEDRVLKARPQATVVRFSGIYGPGRTWLADRVRAGHPVQTDPPAYTNRIHRDDGARVLAWLLSRRLAGDPLPPCLVASDDDPAPLAEVTAWIAELLDVPAPPASPRDPAAGSNKRCRNELLKDLGYTFLFPSYREGYEDMLD
ncbi:MAG: SDR family oxidoreductase [Krumholzibacteria bacterium]|nr:SDR family oxidoreductase [Candidatus Krumholzibacteria bacterium]